MNIENIFDFQAENGNVLKNKMEVRRMRPKPKISPLDRKIKPNPRYSAVEPVVNTGSNLRY